MYTYFYTYIFILYQERRQDSQSCTWSDINRHHLQAVEEIRETQPGSEERKEAKANRRAWRIEVAWQLSQRSCFQMCFFGIWQAVSQLRD